MKSSLKNKLESSIFIKSVDIIKSGDLRIATKIQYPNGECVDVYLFEDEGEYWLSDSNDASLFIKNAGWTCENDIDRKDAFKISRLIEAMFPGVVHTPNGMEKKVDFSPSEHPEFLVDIIYRLASAIEVEIFLWKELIGERRKTI